MATPCTRCGKAGHRSDNQEFHPKTGRAAKAPTGGGTPSKPARMPREAPTVNGAKALLIEKLDEQIADTKAELRALERLKMATLGG